jgi:L-ascorbate metabolism protein UlaG (beta-lactamase superfamily)
MNKMNEINLTWLGQSGFILQTPETVIACDLYLSDYCQKKSRLDHTRKMPIPIVPESLDNIDHYLITHGHIDHFDPETVRPIMQASKAAKFYCPPTCQSLIDEFFSAKTGRFELLKTKTQYALSPGIRLIAIPAAHEDLEKDETGEYVAFSYLVLFEKYNKAVFFGGDTIPFAGQGQLISESVPEGFELTMVLPVNGRDQERAKLGFKGNLTLMEALELYRECSASLLVPCHFGMFELNDIKEPLTEAFFSDNHCQAHIPELNQELTF